jgi:hypothetical protein
MNWLKRLGLAAAAVALLGFGTAQAQYYNPYYHPYYNPYYQPYYQPYYGYGWGAPFVFHFGWGYHGGYGYRGYRGYGWHRR